MTCWSFYLRSTSLDRDVASRRSVLVEQWSFNDQALAWASCWITWCRKHTMTLRSWLNCEFSLWASDYKNFCCYPVYVGVDVVLYRLPRKHDMERYEMRC